MRDQEPDVPEHDEEVHKPQLPAIAGLEGQPLSAAVLQLQDREDNKLQTKGGRVSIQPKTYPNTWRHYCTSRMSGGEGVGAESIVGRGITIPPHHCYFAIAAEWTNTMEGI